MARIEIRSFSLLFLFTTSNPPTVAFRGENAVLSPDLNCHSVCIYFIPKIPEFTVTADDSPVRTVFKFCVSSFSGIL